MIKITPDKLNAILVDKMRERIPDGTNLVNVLMEILSIGREAVYRRFRGEVPFTLNEAVIISRKLGVSVDNLTGANFKGETLFDLNFFNMSDPVEIYHSTIDNYMHVFKSINPSSIKELWNSSNRISLFICMKYRNLAKFHLFKWMYQQDVIACRNQATCFDELTFSSKLIEKEQELSSILDRYQNNNYIWDRTVFLSLINDLKYFKSINLISDEKIQEIKKELQSLIDELETASVQGVFENGNEVNIYLSNINFDTSYSYIESEDINISFIKIFDLNIISSRDQKVFESMKKWIQSLKKFSVLITQSAEIERYKFFKQQRDYINEL